MKCEIWRKGFRIELRDETTQPGMGRSICSLYPRTRWNMKQDVILMFEVNWSAWGGQNTDTTWEFVCGMMYCTRIAERLNKRWVGTAEHDVEYQKWFAPFLRSEELLSSMVYSEDAKANI